MKQALLVPMKLDVLRLPRSTGVAGAFLDLEALPWSSAAWGRDVNADTPFMASAIAVPPFGGSQRVLEAGFHLHWALPDALCRGVLDKETGKTSFPAVPNRFLVTRILDGSIKRWVIESDYIWSKLADWPEDENFPPHRQGLAVTLMAHDLNDRDQPFQHIGRAFSWTEWQETDPTCRMASGKLTVVGYGDLTFSAYHPHCHSVFGFSDPWEGAGEVPENVEYRVVGWYADAKDDPLSAEHIVWDSAEAANATLKLPSHQWKVQTTQQPERTICFAGTRIHAGAAETAPIADACVATVGSTATEAMSVYLAARLSDDPETKAKIEDQLEALQMQTVMTSGDLDLAARLRIARHQRGFRPIPGVPLWKVTQTKSDLTIPDALAAALDADIRALNQLEADLHLRTVEHQAAQQALYADWCKYMAIAYRAPDELSHLEIDVAKDYIERVHLRSDRPNGAPVVVEKAIDIAKIQKSIEDRIASANAKINAYRLSISSEEAVLKVEQIPGPQFWCPNDPIVLITGGGLRFTERYGRDGRGQPDGFLACRSKELPDVWGEKKPDFTSIADSLAVPAVIDETVCTGFSESSGKLYNPLLVEWSIDLYPAESDTPPRFTGQGSYKPDVIEKNYTIAARAIDLQPIIRPTPIGDPALSGNLNIVANADRYQGRTFLASHASDTILTSLCSTITETLLKSYAPLEDERYSKAYRTMLAQWHQRAQGSAFYPVDPTTNQAGGYRLEVSARAHLKAWYLERPLGPDGNATLASRLENERFDDPLWTAICALDLFYDATGRRRYFLSASLDGFNDGLLGFTKLPVLPVDEPIGFDHYRRFSQAIGRLTGQLVGTPEPNNPFSPIRSGELEVSALRVLDSFGQLLDIEPTQVLGPIRYVASARQGAILFPPRVVPPIHAKFRWLEAELSHAELVDVPGSEVICGWLVPNTNTRSITVFNRSGMGLGLLAIDRDENYVEWVPAPGQPSFASESGLSSRERDILQMNAAIDNAHLRKVIEHLWAAPTAYLSAFIDTLADAQENIDPEGSNHYSSMAMLMGSALAVARAELDILALNPTNARGDWVDFERRIRGERSSDDGFTRIRFPMRLGDYRRLSDGVAGYWIEHPDGSFADRRFYAQSADDVSDLGGGNFEDNYQIRAHKETPHDLAIAEATGESINILQTIADAPLSLTILFDPRGVVHLSTGILPTKVINVPPAYFAEALQNIELWLKVGPLLARQGRNDLPLPSDPEYDVVWRASAWSKTEQGADLALVWDDLRYAQTIRGDEVLAAIKKLGLKTDLALLEKNDWLTKADPNGIRYRLLPKEKRGPLGLAEASETALSDSLELGASQIEEILLGARFDSGVEAREGFLVFQRGRGVT